MLLGATLDEQGFSSLEVGLVLGAVLAGTVIASLFIGRHGDRIGRRRCYRALYAMLAVTGVVFAFSGSLWLLVAVSLFGRTVDRSHRVRPLHLP